MIAFDLPALLGIGVMLLAASPGGTTANLFSHLFRGDVALNITLTAINTVVAIATLPLITNLTIAYFEKSDTVSMPLIEVAKVFVLILVPVAIGMVVNARRHDFAQRMDRPVRIGSAVGLVAALFCATSLVVGYVVPRAAGVPDDQAIASSFEIGVHNGTLAIFVAVEVLDSTAISVPAAVYSVFMFVLAALWGMTISRRVQARTVAV